MEKALKSYIPWTVAAIAAVLTLRGLLTQAATQADLVAAMHGVHRNVREAAVLTEETARAMAPLAATSKTLETMNGRLAAAGSDLAGMNQSLQRVTDRQREMLDHLGGLNDRTRSVVETLGTVEARNRALLTATTALGRQTGAGAGALERLSGLTEESIEHLALLNLRFSFLR